MKILWRSDVEGSVPGSELRLLDVDGDKIFEADLASLSFRERLRIAGRCLLGALPVSVNFYITDQSFVDMCRRVMLEDHSRRIETK